MPCNPNGPRCFGLAVSEGNLEYKLGLPSVNPVNLGVNQSEGEDGNTNNCLPTKEAQYI